MRQPQSTKRKLPYQRAATACTECRRRKTRCIVDDDKGQSCGRCRRLKKTCSHYTAQNKSLTTNNLVELAADRSLHADTTHRHPFQGPMPGADGAVPSRTAGHAGSQSLTAVPEASVAQSFFNPRNHAMLTSACAMCERACEVPLARIEPCLTGRQSSQLDLSNEAPESAAFGVPRGELRERTSHMAQPGQTSEQVPAVRDYGRYPDSWLFGHSYTVLAGMLACTFV